MGSGTASFGSDTVDGTSRQVLNFPTVWGTSLNPTTILPSATCSVVALFKHSNVSG